MKTLVGAAEPPDRPRPAIVTTSTTTSAGTSCHFEFVDTTLTPARLRAMRDRHSGGR